VRSGRQKYTPRKQFPPDTTWAVLYRERFR
jgi:hypothetical protein